MDHQKEFLALTTISHQHGGPLQISGATGEIIRRDHVVVNPPAPNDERLARLSPSEQLGEAEVRIVRGELADQRQADIEEQQKITGAIADPRYKSNPSYRAEVERKVLAGEFSADPAKDKLAVYRAEFDRTGNLSADSLARASRELGLPPSVIREHVEGKRAQENSMESLLERAQYASILEVTGTDASFNQLAAWLTAHDPETLQAINTAAFGRSPGVTRSLVEHAFKNYKAAQR
jgi:hypothetical protein